MDYLIRQFDLFRFVCVVVFGLLMSASVSAQADLAGKWEFAGYLGHTTIDENIAAENFIEDNALSVGFTADYDHGNWLTTLGAEFISYRDNAGFSQLTEDFFGDVDEQDSSANGFVVSAATGPAWHFSEARTMLYVQAGMSAMLASDRSIANCSNCAEEDIDVDAGFFAKAGVVKTLQRVSFGFHVVNYFNDDGLENSIQLSIGTAY